MSTLLGLFDNLVSLPGGSFVVVLVFLVLVFLGAAGVVALARFSSRLRRPGVL